MILQYFKKKENKYKIIADKIYIQILATSRELINQKFFKKANFDLSFEIISIILVIYLKKNKYNESSSNQKINDELIKNFINDLDNSLREIGIGDMSIGKYVKRYVKKFYFRIKVLDPFFINFDKVGLINYFNGLDYTDQNFTEDIINKLYEVYQQIHLNKYIN